MAKFTGKNSLLKAALGEYADYGFQLIEPDDHTLELWFKDKRIAAYNSTKVTIQIIQEGCRNYMAAIARWQ